MMNTTVLPLFIYFCLKKMVQSITLSLRFQLKLHFNEESNKSLSISLIFRDEVDKFN